MSTKLRAIPYRGDDWSQTLARRMWLPMLVMGVMAVAGGLVAGAYSGTQVGNFFGGASADHLGRATATTAWASGVAFLGMALILSSITMVLVNIIRTLRDTGRDVQRSVGAAEVTQLAKPTEGKLIPHVMMMGLMVVVAAFVVGIVQATLLGGLPAAGLADTSLLVGDDLADFGTAQAIGAWVQPLRLLGLAVIFTSIVLTLRTIIKAISFQSQRVEELATELPSPAASKRQAKASA